MLKYIVHIIFVYTNTHKKILVKRHQLYWVKTNKQSLVDSNLLTCSSEILHFRLDTLILNI